MRNFLVFLVVFAAAACVAADPETRTVRDPVKLRQYLGTQDGRIAACETGINTNASLVTVGNLPLARITNAVAVSTTIVTKDSTRLLTEGYFDVVRGSNLVFIIANGSKTNSVDNDINH